MIAEAFYEKGGKIFIGSFCIVYGVFTMRVRRRRLRG